MSSRKPSATEVKKVAETLALAAVGVGSAVLFVTNPKFRRAITDALGLPDKLPSPPRPSPAPPPTRSGTSAPVTGVVYLLQSGPFFKIGWSKDLDQRHRQIKLQLPFPTHAIHQIECSNPLHAETYWHRRFAARRQTASGLSSPTKT